MTEPEIEQIKRRLQLVESEVGRLSGELTEVNAKLARAVEDAAFKKALSGGRG